MTSMASQLPTPMTRPSNGLVEGPTSDNDDEDDDMTPMMDREAAALQLSKLLKAHRKRSWGLVHFVVDGGMEGDRKNWVETP